MVLNQIRKQGYNIVKLRNTFKEQKQLLGIENPIIFDVGAHKGETVSNYLSLFKNPSIFSFEPTPSSYKMLNNMFNGQIKPINKALGSKIGKKEFLIKNVSSCNSFFKIKDYAKKYKNAEENGKILVEVDTIDNFCNKNRIQKVDILKLDVQGYEVEVLKGATSMLTNKKIKLIYAETYFNPAYEGDCCNIYDVGSLLESWGYSLYNIYNLFYDTETKMLRFGESLFITKEILMKMLSG